MSCPNCKAPLVRPGKFCIYCGAPLGPMQSKTWTASIMSAQRLVRPHGVTILSALMGLSGFASLFFGSWYVVVGLVALMTAWGLWTMKSWARTLALLFAAVLGVAGLASFFIPFVGWILGLPFLIMAGVTFSYLQKPQIKQLFVGPERAPAIVQEAGTKLCRVCATRIPVSASFCGICGANQN